MTALKRTDARRDLLQAIADGAVSDEYSIGLGWDIIWDRGPGEGPRYRKVTARWRELHEAKFVKLLPPEDGRHFSPRPGALTESGETLLLRWRSM